jgi:phosphoserine phosphatase RsbU/P
MAVLAFLQFQVTAARLRADAASIAITTVALTFAVAALAVYLIRRGRSDRTLLWFAVFGAMYGARIMLGTPVFLAGFGVSNNAAAAIVALITYCIQIPGILFAVSIIDAWGKELARVLLALTFVEAALGTFTVVTGVGIPRMFTVNNLLVIFVFLPGYVWLFYKNSAGYRMVVLKAAFAIFILAVLFDNISGVITLPVAFRTEPFAFVILLAGMGWAAAQRTISDQQRLVSIERELEIARTIQKSILPESVPAVQGLDIAVRYEPMTAVAGDFYDFVRLDDGRLGVLVADVSGHGVPAALIASMLKMAFASHTADAADPAQLLSKLNAAMCGKFSAHFVTAVYAVVDHARGTLTYSGAAHPPILLSRDGSAQELAENGLMLGAFSFAQYTNASVSLSRGDRLLLYTDGLVEASNTNAEEFGAERLKSALHATAAAQLITNVFDQVSAWSGMKNGRAQEDDLTAVAIAVN